MDSPYDENQTYQKYNFFFTDKTVIDSLIKTVRYGEPARNIMENDNFSLIVTKNNKIVDSVLRLSKQAIWIKELFGKKLAGLPIYL